MGSSNILTVSYGTFSCTLEGFDDSFGTMKAIAEYFRDLASEDRYFGAEPATPDADMLAHIASSELNRKVNAKIEDGSVTLRPGITAEKAEDTSEVAQIAEPEVVIEPAVAEAVSEPVKEPVVAKAVIEPVVTEAPKEEIAPVKANLVETDLVDADNTPLKTENASTESVAAKLRRIRAVVSQNKGAIASSTEFAEDQHANGFMIDDEDTAYEEEVIAEVTAPAPEVQLEEKVAELVDAPIIDHISEETSDDTQEVETEEYFEDEIEEIAEQAEPEAEIVAAEEADSGDALADFMSAMKNGTEATEEVTEEAADKIEETAAYEQFPEIDDSTAPVSDASEDDIMKNIQGTLGETSLSATDEADLVNELTNIELEEELDDAFVSEVEHKGLNRGISSMLRSERAGRALGTDDDKEADVSVDRLLDETNAKLDTDDSTRRRSVISHLRAAVAATVADRNELPVDSEESSDESELYRLDLADAVQPQQPSTETNETAALVKPDRPVAVRKQHVEASSPLVLVSKQRVDEENDAAEPEVSVEEAAAPAVEPVRAARMRRIVKSPLEAQDEPAENILTGGLNDPEDSENLFADSTSFADFAEKMGATSMPDILEAAAAYNAYVEGQPDFGRPQIMRQVASFAGKEQFNREEGLRSFGQLLRQGKIIKVNRGRFEIADTTRFKPADRYAGE